MLPPCRFFVFPMEIWRPRAMGGIAFLRGAPAPTDVHRGRTHRAPPQKKFRRRRAKEFFFYHPSSALTRCGKFGNFFARRARHGGHLPESSGTRARPREKF